MQRFHHGPGISVGDGEQGLCGPLGFAAALFPVLKGAGADPYHQREFELGDMELAPDFSDAWNPEMKYAARLHPAAFDPARLLDAFNKFCEIIFLHFRHSFTRLNIRQWRMKVKVFG